MLQYPGQQIGLTRVPSPNENTRREKKASHNHVVGLSRSRWACAATWNGRDRVPGGPSLKVNLATKAFLDAATHVPRDFSLACGSARASSRPVIREDDMECTDMECNGGTDSILCFTVQEAPFRAIVWMWEPKLSGYRHLCQTPDDCKPIKQKHADPAYVKSELTSLSLPGV